MPAIQYDPATSLPVAVRHESATGWGKQLLDQYGLARLEQQVGDELFENAPCLVTPGATNPIEVTAAAAVDDETVTVTAWALCTRPDCVAHGAALDTLNTFPRGSRGPAADLPDLPDALTAARAQLAHPAMQFTHASTAEPLVWAHRTGVLREAVVHLTWEAHAHAARDERPAAATLRTAVEDTLDRSAALGLELGAGPSDLTRLDAENPAIWASTARTLHDLFTALAAAVERHPVPAAAGTQEKTR